jgi:hypothetical protein
MPCQIIISTSLNTLYEQHVFYTFIILVYIRLSLYTVLNFTQIPSVLTADAQILQLNKKCWNVKQYKGKKMQKMYMDLSREKNRIK